MTSILQILNNIFSLVPKETTENDYIPVPSFDNHLQKYIQTSYQIDKTKNKFLEGVSQLMNESFKEFLNHPGYHKIHAHRRTNARNKTQMHVHNYIQKQTIYINNLIDKFKHDKLFSKLIKDNIENIKAMEQRLNDEDFTASLRSSGDILSLKSIIISCIFGFNSHISCQYMTKTQQDFCHGLQTLMIVFINDMAHQYLNDTSNYNILEFGAPYLNDQEYYDKYVLMPSVKDGRKNINKSQYDIFEPKYVCGYVNCIVTALISLIKIDYDYDY